MKLVLSFLLLAMVMSDPLPIAVFHGFGDFCLQPGMLSFTRKLGKMVGTYSKCIEIGRIGAIASVTWDFEEQGKEACRQIASNKNFDNGFQVVGLSQGGLLARYVVENCPGAVPVRSLVTLGTPHTGVDAIPHCFSGLICNTINFFARQMVYFDIVQRNIGPAGYFRDPAQLDRYKRKSHFLAALNNEIGSEGSNDLHHDRMAALEHVFLGWFNKDSMIYPAESALFSELQKDMSLKPMEETETFQRLALDELLAADKIVFHEFDGDHLQFTMEEIEEFVVPLLKDEE